MQAEVGVPRQETDRDPEVRDPMETAVPSLPNDAARAPRAGRAPAWDDDDAPVHRLSAGEAARFRDQRRSPSPWRVVLMSTEAGVAFAVNDGQAGFPATFLTDTADVDMKVENQSLRIRSARTARCYLGPAPELKDAEGFVDTGDVLELRGDRYHFAGRRDGIINVGGNKVHPEEVESVINRHPYVHMSLVRTRRNPITGALVVADVVLKTASEPRANGVHEIQSGILSLCRETLPPHKVPATINIVAALAVSETGKLIRRHA